MEEASQSVLRRSLKGGGSCLSRQAVRIFLPRVPCRALKRLLALALSPSGLCCTAPVLRLRLRGHKLQRTTHPVVFALLSHPQLSKQQSQPAAESSGSSLGRRGRGMLHKSPGDVQEVESSL